MSLELEVRGVGKRSGIFFAGRPATLLAFDDAIVLLPASTLGGLLGAQGAVGAQNGSESATSASDGAVASRSE